MTSNAPSHAHDAETLTRAQHMVAEQVGTLMEFWGFKRILGRIWTVLYLAESPMTAADIGTALGISASAVSVSLGELRRWGVVNEAVGVGPGKGRAQRWRAETDTWAMVSNVLRQRELPLVQRFEETLKEAVDALGEEPQTPRTRHARAALRNLLALASLGRTLLHGLLETGKMNADALRRFGG
jgi:DNA-binding transcriptional regulator GbsR (MarR family)